MAHESHVLLKLLPWIHVEINCVCSCRLIWLATRRLPDLLFTNPHISSYLSILRDWDYMLSTTTYEIRFFPVASLIVSLLIIIISLWLMSLWLALFLFLRNWLILEKQKRGNTFCSQSCCFEWNTNEFDHVGYHVNFVYDVSKI